MGLYKAFVQSTTTTPVQFANTATITSAILSSTAPAVILPARSNNRRGMIIENNGSVPMIFGYGATVSVATRTALLNPNDVFSDDVSWQGVISAMSVGSAGSANFTEIVVI